MAKFPGTTYELTPQFVKDLSFAKSGQDLYWAANPKGFGVLVGRRTKSFVLQREVAGKTRRVTIGRYGPQGLTLKAALTQAETKRAELTLNLHPFAPRGKGITLGEAWCVYEQYLASKRRSPTTIRVYGYLLDKYLSDWMTKPLAKITRVDVRERHQQLTEQIAAGKHSLRSVPAASRNGKSTANLVFTIFSAIYKRATREHEYLRADPCATVNWNEIDKTRGPLLDKELPVWYKTVIALPNKVQRDALLFLLFSGMRKTAVCEMRWEDVDLDGKKLRVPASKGGKKRAFDLPLSDVLLAVLRRRKAEHPLYAVDARCAPWVFSSPAAPGTGHITAVHATVPGVQYVVHELRDSFASVARRYARVDHYTIATLLNHKQPGANVTDKYAQTGDEDLVAELRVPMQRIGHALRALLEPTAPSSKVVPMRQRRRL